MNSKYNDDTLDDAYDMGFDTGYGIAADNLPDLESYEFQDEFISDCCQTESDHFRQFSPFEFTAKDFNETDDPDSTWDAYNTGVYDGIVAALDHFINIKP